MNEGFAMTLSQRGLAIRAGKGAKWIRAQGRIFYITNRKGEREMWRARRYSNGRLFCYEFAVKSI